MLSLVDASCFSLYRLHMNKQREKRAKMNKISCFHAILHTSCEYELSWEKEWLDTRSLAVSNFFTVLLMLIQGEKMQILPPHLTIGHTFFFSRSSFIFFGWQHFSRTGSANWANFKAKKGAKSVSSTQCVGGSFFVVWTTSVHRLYKRLHVSQSLAEVGEEWKRVNSNQGWSLWVWRVEKKSVMRNKKRRDDETGIWTLAGSAHWISSPTP